MGVALSSFECCVERERDLPPYGTLDQQVEKCINTEVANLYMQCNRQKGSLVETGKELQEMVMMLKKWRYHVQTSDSWVTSKIKAAQAQNGHLHLSLREFRYWFRGQIIADDANRSLLLRRAGCSEKDGDIHAELKTTVVKTSPKPGAYSSQIESTPMVMKGDLSSNAYTARTPHRRSHGAMRRSGRV